MTEYETADLCEQAAHDIAMKLLFFSAPVRQWKEKYRSVRVYTGFGIQDLHGLIKPSHVYYRWSDRPILNWLNTATLPIFDLLYPTTTRFHEFIYRIAYQRAIKAYPSIRENILCGADYSELLKHL